VRLKGGTVGLVMLASLFAAPAAFGSTASLAVGGGTVVYRGDAGADSLTLSRYVNTRGTEDPSDDIVYYVLAETGISAGSGCQPIGSNMAACRVTQGPKRYDIATGSGDDRVELTGATSGGSADLGPGADRFTGLASGTSADSVHGAGGADTINGGAGNDGLDGGADDDVLGGGAGNDGLDGGPGDDELEFGAPGASLGVGVGADDLRGGDGVDRLSYNDHPAAITVTLDEQPGDGSAREGDNVHDDIETIIGTTLDDVLIGDDLGQDLYGHAGRDRIEGGGGADLLNGGSGADVIRGGAGDDALEGSADGDLLDGGPGRDLFVGDNECVAQPCTGGADEIQARDGEQDTVNCGVGVDTAAVDALDIVALDTQQGCENVDRAAPDIAPLAAAATDPVALPTMRVRGPQRIRALLKRGLRVDVTCPAACRIRGRLILRKTVVAGARRTRTAGAVTRLRLKANRAGRRRLKHHRKLLLTLVIDVTDSAGHTTTLARPVTLKVAKKR
jgi:Ca2+-binding RTX toxin-like protein